MRKALLEPISIPFIAGQWSLPRSLPESDKACPDFNPLHCGAVVASLWVLFAVEGCLTYFNPLHCGAVVASRAKEKDDEDIASYFNPLHCGAVVASCRLAVGVGGERRISIPFIAGQWSLPAQGFRVGSGSDDFNPLHCGAVVASLSDRLNGLP